MISALEIIALLNLAALAFFALVAFRRGKDF